MENDNNNVTNVFGVMFKDCNFPNATFMQQNNIVEVKNESQAPSSEDAEFVNDSELNVLFFNPRIFDSQKRLSELRFTIGQYLDLGEANQEFGDYDGKRFNLKQKNEWFYLMKAIEEAKIANPFNVPDLLNFVLEWYPKILILGNNETIEDFKVNLTKSVSAEKTRWKYQDDVTSIGEMTNRISILKINYDSVIRVINIARDLRNALIKLKGNQR